MKHEVHFFSVIKNIKLKIEPKYILSYHLFGEAFKCSYFNN